MDEDQQAVLAGMAARRLEARRAAARRDVAQQIFEDRGSVTAAQVDRKMAEQWVEPTEEQLAAEVAAKCWAAVEFEQRQRESQVGAIEGARAKVAKFEKLLESVRADLAAAEAELTAAEQRVASAVALASAATLKGDPAAAPAPVNVTAQAATAHGAAEVS